MRSKAGYHNNTEKNKVVKVHFDYFYLVVSPFALTKAKKMNYDLGGELNAFEKKRVVPLRLYVRRLVLCVRVRACMYILKIKKNFNDGGSFHQQ